MTPKLATLVASGTTALVVDQLSKLAVDALIPAHSPEHSVTVVEGFFYITHARNPGAAFGLLLDWPWEWRLPVFVGVALLAFVVIGSFYRALAPGERFNSFALGLILGGSLGNLIDRVVRGEVIDFLHFRLWGGFSWPDFNVADSCLVVGVTALVIELLAAEGAARAARQRGASPDAGDDRPH